MDLFLKTSMIMKPLLILTLSSLLGLSCQSQKKISVSVNYLQPYCGGARPTPEMEAEAQTPKPLTSSSLVLIDSKGKAKTVKTDKNGKLNLKLKEGNYLLKETWRHKQTTPNGEAITKFEESCLKEEWKLVLQSISVSKTEVKVTENYTIINYCDHSIPCFKESFKPPMRE